MYAQTRIYLHALPPCNATSVHLYVSKVGEPYHKGESVCLVLCCDYQEKMNKHHMYMKQNTQHGPLQVHILLYIDSQA